MEIMDRGIKLDEDKALELVQALVDRNKVLEVTNSVLVETNDALTGLVEDKDNVIKELVKELDSANDEALRLENKISDMKCEGVKE